MPEHTPGPWIAGRPDMATAVDGVKSKWIYAGDQCVAVASGRIAGPWEEVMANATLIAAAPDLLAACEYCLDMLSQPVGEETLEERIGMMGGFRSKRLLEDALAKAKLPQPQTP